MWFFRALLGSFYSPETYQYVRNSRGHGLKYSILLVALMTLVLTVYLGFYAHRAFFEPRGTQPPFFDALVMQVAEQLPVMTFKDGMLQTRERGPHYIHMTLDVFNHHEQGIVATIDTSGRTTYANMKTPMLFTAHEMVVEKDGKKEIKAYKELTYASRVPTVINRAVALDLGRQVIAGVRDNLPMVAVVVGLFGWLGYTLVLYVQRIVLLLVLGIGGLIIAALVGHTPKLRYQDAMRMAAVSFTPVALMDLALLLFGRHDMSLPWLLLCGCIMLGAALVVTRNAVLAARP